MGANAGGALSGAASGAEMGTQIMPGWGTAIGAVAGGLLGACSGGGDAPATVPYVPVDTQQAQQQAIQGNQVNESSLEALLSRSNTFQQGQASSMMEKAMPGYTALAGKLTNLASTMATNPYDIPSDVQANLTRKAAEMGVNTGRSGQSGDFSLLRYLGVNSLQYGQSRISQATNLTSMLASIAPKVNPMSPLSFMTTDQAQLATTANNNTMAPGVYQGAANAQAASDNWNSLSTLSSLSSIAGQAKAGNWFGTNTTTSPLDKNGMNGQALYTRD